MARVRFTMAELANALGDDFDNLITHYQRAFQYLQKGGIDLSVKKWADLVTIRTIE